MVALAKRFETLSTYHTFLLLKLFVIFFNVTLQLITLADSFLRKTYTCFKQNYFKLISIALARRAASALCDEASNDPARTSSWG